MAVRPSVLAVFAHPDDESFAVAGTLALAHARSIRTALVTATDGESGRSTGVEAPTREALARIRRGELLRAAGVLGVDRVFLLGYVDGALDRADPEGLIGGIVAAIRSVHPDVVITFGPEGAPNRHADHRAISRAATAAFFAAGNPTLYPDDATRSAPWQARRLYYTTWTTGDLPDAPVAGMPVTCEVDITSVHDIKRRAFEEHRSQQHHRATFERTVARFERYFLAAGWPQPAALVGDLFAG
jgi:LmbE family N-acetylglucosaminyl deacetylase